MSFTNWFCFDGFDEMMIRPVHRRTLCLPGEGTVGH